MLEGDYARRKKTGDILRYKRGGIQEKNFTKSDKKMEGII